MKIVTQLRITYLMILLLGLSSAGLSLWNSRQSSLYIEQIIVSHSIYESYLSLESRTYQLFKQYGDAIIIGDQSQRPGKQLLIGLIADDSRQIRTLIEQKRFLSGSDVGQNLDNLATIDSAVERLIMRLDQFSPTGTREFASDWERLSTVLEEEIDQNFRTLIKNALDGEKNDLERIAASVSTAVRNQQWFTTFLGLASITLASLGIIFLDKRITVPINTLLTGVRKFGEGQLDHPLAIRGRDEFAEIGSSFDVMAAQVARQNRLLLTEQESLKAAVQDRTRQLSIMLEDVKRIDSSRKRMIADVSHELRTPLTIIKGEADIALRGASKSTEEYQDALMRVREAASHTARLVDDLLFVARNEAGEVQLKLEPVDLYQTVLDVVKTFGHDVPITTDLHQALIQADRGRLSQALLVLLENARHHGGGGIHIRLDASDRCFRVSVEDSGPGMTEQEKSQAFERFFRGSNAADRYRDGAGLGLPVALSIAQAHGGSIDLEDRPGGGLIAILCIYPDIQAASVMAH